MDAEPVEVLYAICLSHAISNASKEQSTLSEAALKANRILIAKREEAIKPLKRFKKSVFQELCVFHGLPSSGTIQIMMERLVQKVIISLFYQYT